MRVEKASAIMFYMHLHLMLDAGQGGWENEELRLTARHPAWMVGGMRLVFGDIGTPEEKAASFCYPYLLILNLPSRWLSTAIQLFVLILRVGPRWPTSKW